MKIKLVFLAVLAAAMCATLTRAQKPREGSGTSANKSGAQKSQGLDAMLNSLGVEQASSGTQGDRNWWGVTTKTLPLGVADSEAHVPAAEVVELRPGSAAASGGLRKGDLIVGVQMRQIERAADLDRAVAAVPPGGNLMLQVIRGGEPLEITVVRNAGGARSGVAQINQSVGPTAVPDAATGQIRTGIFINGLELTPVQAQQLRATYGYVAPPGRYWYDSNSGLYGVMGREAAGFMQPGHDFGTLAANASNGTTGVFMNGRQINMVEAMYIQSLFGAVYQGRWWLDGRTGNLGAEGSPMPIANVYMALQQSQRSSQGGGYGWHSKITGASGGSDGKCSYVSIPGSGSVMTGNCD